MKMTVAFKELHEEMVATFGEISVIHGKDGRTPVRGVDYWTDADKAEIIAAVIASLPVYGGETA